MDEQVDDARLVEAVRARLARDRLLDAHGIEVSARDGVVTLDGETPRAADGELAGLIAAETAGVAGVENRIRHHPGPSSADHLGETQEGPHYEGRWGRWVPPVIP